MSDQPLSLDDITNAAKASLRKIEIEYEALVAALDSIGIGCSVIAVDGTLVMNSTVANELIGIVSHEDVGEMGDWSVRAGCFYPDRVTPYPTEELPATRSLMKGEVIGQELMWIQPPGMGGFEMLASARPIFSDDGSLAGVAAIFIPVEGACESCPLGGLRANRNS